MPDPSSSTCWPDCSSTILLFFLSLTLSFYSTATLAHENLHFSYTKFNQNEVQSLVFSNNSNVDNDALQITRNSATPSNDITNTSGQITYFKPLQLWSNSSNFEASFNTSFLLNFNKLAPLNNDTNTSAASDYTGGGITFYLSSNAAFPYLPNSFGQWLGLFDGRIVDPANQQAKLVAIEFDVFKDSFDPDANHVGVDVNGSIRSAYVESLGRWNVSLTNASDANGIFTSVWIDYDCHLRTLNVYLANQGMQMSEKPARPIISEYYIDLRRYLPETVYVGFSASLGTFREAHCVLQWNFTSTGLPPKPNDDLVWIIIVSSIVGAAMALLVIAVLILTLVARRRREHWARFMADLTSVRYGPRKFSYWDLKRATNGFSEERRLGQGGFGTVYKGVLNSKDMTTEVAVKCLSQRSKQGEREFRAEVMSMGRMRHKNLVQLLGWSYSRRSRLMLVYEYLPNGSLDQWIGQAAKGNAKVMGWERRYQVMKGLAAGLAYLHEEWEMVVLHRDLKPSNVMLDAGFNARIGDFGLAKLVNCDNQQGQLDTKPIIAGTLGYLAPECLEQGIIGKESDMYSMGVIAIELATGRNLSANYLHTLYLLLKESRLQEAADPQLPSFDPTQLELLLKIGLACCHPDPLARPSIGDVVHALSSSSTSCISVPESPSFSSVSENRGYSSSSISSYVMQMPYGR